MCSIETITSKTCEIKVQTPDTETGFEEILVEVLVWNGTVANLALSCIGSCAIEILLTSSLLISNGFVAEDLGPNTIFGAYALNFLVMTAISVMVIPSSEIRTIKHIKVFALTSFFSILAYVWLALILLVITPNFVDLWEAVVTLLFYPFFIIISFITDRAEMKKKPKSDGDMELLCDPGKYCNNKFRFRKVTTFTLSNRYTFKLPIDFTEIIHVCYRY